MPTKEIQLIWMPDEAQLQQVHEVSQCTSKEKDSYIKCSAIVSFRRFIKSCLGVNLKINDVQLMTNISYQSVDDSDDEDMLLEKKKNVLRLEFLYTLSCKLELESESESCRKNLIHMFCSRKFHKEAPQVWLAVNDFFVPEKVELDNFIAYSEIDVHSFGLGSLVEPNTFVQHFDSATSLSKVSKYKITHVKVKLATEYFELYFVLGNSEVPLSKRSALTHRLFKLSYKYNSLCKLLICHSSKDDFTIYLHSKEYPLLHVAVKKSGNNKDSDASTMPYISYDCSIDASVMWLRVVELFESCPSEISQDFIKNSTLKMKFRKSEYTSIRHLLEQLCSHIIAYFTSMQIIPASSDARISSITSADYDCFYALKCILTRNNDFIDQIVAKNQLKELNCYLSEKIKENPKVLTETLFHIYNQVDQGYIVMFLHSIKTFYTQLIKSDSKPFQQQNLSGEVIYIKKAILMPCHVRFVPPEPQLKNRILRKCKPDNLLRVTIRDTDMTRIDYTLKGIAKYGKEYKIKFLETYIKRQLSNGIKLGNRRYEYFGMSPSQLKSHSLWCYAKGKDKKTIDEIRKDIGDLDAIHDAPKFMARMGLSFSQAIGHIKVPQKFTNVNSPEKDVIGVQKHYMTDSEDDDEVKKHIKGKYVEDSEGSHEESDDTECEKKESMKSTETDDDDDDDDPYLFSDGIGRISEELADEIYEELKLQEEKPSAFQIRYAGCKGMLVVDPLLKGRFISFRESMKKYNSEDDSLEILKISKPRNMFLNRPFITILEQKGVSKEVFLCFQKRMIHSLIKSMFYDEDAQRLLRACSKLPLNYENLLKSGISFTEDLLFRSMILSIFKCQISLLKTKARISLPENEARNMFGVLDETGTLEYGEVFVQYTVWNEKTTRVLEGIVVVTKPPCLHPGDVRKFQAVDVPGLRHIRDCIVFPAKGFRPHPDEMAGSDLDGDEYLVIWNKDLIFEQENSPPMHYAVKKKKTSKKLKGVHPVQVSDELDHFSNYILNDSVGRIANAHLAKADKEGIFSKVCMRLAKKHAKAVDFAKTGHPAIMSNQEIVGNFPDFMEKFNRNHTYISSKALGHLYRNCKDLEIGLEATTENMEPTLDPDLEHESWEVYEKSAKNTYHQYCKKISYCLKTYGLESEGEFLTSNFIHKTKLHDNNDMRNLLEIIEYEVLWLVQKYEEEFFEEFGGKPEPLKCSEAMFQKASAWYVVSYKSNSITGEGARYFGLPWMVSDVLSALKQTKQGQKNLSSNIFVKKASYIEKAIDEYVAKYMDLNKSLMNPNILKMEILDAARKVLSKWLLSWKDGFMYNSSDNLMQMEKCIDDVFSSVSEWLLSCNDNYIIRCMKTEEAKKVMSSGYYVLATLIQMSEMGTGHNEYASFSPCLQELGLSAWVTLIRLACSSNVQHLGLKLSGDSIDLSFYNTQAEVYDIFQIEPSIALQDSFWSKFREDESSIKKYFLDKFGVKDIALHPEVKTDNRKFRAKGSGDLLGKKDNSILTLFVKGSRFAIERLKHTVVMEEFVKCVIDGKPISYSSKPSSSRAAKKKIMSSK